MFWVVCLCYCFGCEEGVICVEQQYVEVLYWVDGMEVFGVWDEQSVVWWMIGGEGFGWGGCGDQLGYG